LEYTARTASHCAHTLRSKPRCVASACAPRLEQGTTKSLVEHRSEASNPPAKELRIRCARCGARCTRRLPRDRGLLYQIRKRGSCGSRKRRVTHETKQRRRLGVDPPRKFAEESSSRKKSSGTCSSCRRSTRTNSAIPAGRYTPTFHSAMSDIRLNHNRPKDKCEKDATIPGP